jgi:hypothetical protein
MDRRCSPLKILNHDLCGLLCGLAEQSPSLLDSTYQGGERWNRLPSQMVRAELYDALVEHSRLDLDGVLGGVVKRRPVSTMSHPISFP